MECLLSQIHLVILELFFHITEMFEETQRNYRTFCKSAAFCSVLLRWNTLPSPQEVPIMEFNVYSTPASVFAMWVVH